MRLRLDCLALVLSVGGGIAAGELSAAEGASPIGERPSRSNLLANGGFEFAGRLSQPRLRRVPNEGVTFENADPLLPARWTWAGGGRAELGLVSEAHSGQHAVRVIAPAGAWLHLNMSLIEVVPNATYEFGVWLRGSGKGAIAVYGNAFEGRQELAREALTGTSAWSQSRRGLTIPGHIRTISIELTAWGECDLSWDDVFFSAELAQPFDPDAVLQRKQSADEHTIAFVDFDQPGSYRLEGGAKLTADDGGRFGKGVQLDRKSSSSATVPLSLDRMPDEGTLEFWFAPDEVPEHIHCYCVLLAGDTDVLKLQADTSDMLRLSWRTSAGIYDPQHSLACGSWQSRDWFRPGQWQHVAAQWNRQALRYYLNGTLVDYSTDRPLPFFQTPSAIRLGSQHSVYDWSGRIDEVRLSRVQRCGPFVPVGAKWSEFVVAAAAEEQPAAPARPVPPPNFVTARQALIGRIPALPTESTALDATALKPLLHDDARFQLEPNQPAPGMTTALIGNEGRLLRDPDNDGGYWKLGEIRPGRYFVGVWYGSGKPGAEAPQSRFGALCVYLNGHLLQLATTSDPVQVAPGVYFAEAQTAEAADLRPGDEIAVLPESIRRMRIARLTLYPQEPVRGHGWIPENYGATWFSRDTALGLNLDASFGGGARDGFRQVEDLELPADLKKSADGRALAACRLANPLPMPLTIEFSAEVRAYFRELVGEDRATLTIPPHARVTREIPFTVVPTSRRYTIAARAHAVSPPQLNWPAADAIRFFPGVRQLLPWPDPFTAKEERSVEFSGPLPGERVRFGLNGPWQAALTTSLTPPVPPPAGLDWKPRQVPFASWQFPIQNLTPRPHGLYLRRPFTLPEKEGRRTYRLTVGSVLDEGTAYVNGQKVGQVRGGDTPLTCDITAAARAGENELLIVIRDVLAIMDQDYVNPASPTPSVAFLDAPGGGSWSGFGIGKVAMESSPAVAADGLLAVPSVRKQELTARFAVTNHEATPVKVRTTARVENAGQSVLTLGEQELTLAPGQTTPLAFCKSWPSAVLWGPDQPHLYTLAVETVDAASGRRWDLLRERFGFRECWVEGDRLIFNGRPVRLKGSTCQGGGGVNIGDVQWSRGTPYPEFMDEFGYLVSFPLAAIFNSSSRHNVDRDVFWENCRANLLAGAARYGNHPCIIAWDLSNEWLSFLDYGGGDPLKAARRFQTLDRALKERDPSRWTFFNGDEDLHGLHDTFSTHYMLESTNPHPIAGFGFRGHSNYFPDGAFYRPLDQTLGPGQPITVNAYRGTTWRTGEKVLMNTENLWKVDKYMPPGLSKFVDEDDVLGPGIDSGRGPIAWMWKQNLDGHRDLGVSAVCNYTPVAGVARRGQRRQCFIMPDHTHHAFVGATITRSYSLHNDLFRPSDLVLQWQLLDPAGKPAAGGDERRAMASGDLQRGQLSFIAPDVASRTRFTLQLKLVADGAAVYEEQRDLDVWPDTANLRRPEGPDSSVAEVVRLRTTVEDRSLTTSATGKSLTSGRVGLSPARITLFDPAGTTAAVFARAGVACTRISELAAPAGEPAGAVLVVGENALQGDTQVAVGQLNNFVSAGGRVIVLAQSRVLPGLPVKTVVEPKEWVSMPFVRTPQHPVMSGLTSWDLHFWSPDHVSAAGAYSKPDAGPFITLADSGTDVGLEWVQLMECYRGRGSYLLNQFPVAGKYAAEPMARELLQRLLSYATGAHLWRSPTGKLRVSANPASAVLAKLRNLGVACEPLPADVPRDAASVWLADASELPADFQPPGQWAAALAGGGTVIIHGARPEHAAWLSALAGTRVSLTAQPYGMWEGRAYRNGRPWLLPGLSHIDLYWKRYDGSEGAVAQADDPSLKLEDIIYYSAAAEGGTEHIFPGGLLEIPVGGGRLILDQVRWETTHKQLDRSSARFVSALMTGLGIPVAPYAPPRPLPAEIVYRPLDLTAWANRGFADPQGDDGQGGWSDQGPDIDLHAFPTGQQNFGGVPFAIGAEPRSCIVLKSNARPFPERLPSEARIALGYRVEGLCFLHGLTYGGDGQEVGSYQIEYADGTVHEISLVAGENIRDWVSAPAQLPREKGTQSRIVWTGTTKVFPVTSVWQMRWVNPQPEVLVKSVCFANPKRAACPILIALTAVVPDEQAVADRTAAKARAKQLLEQGLAAFTAGRDTEARDLLKKALSEDGTLHAAHLALANVYEKLQDEDGALATYRAWARAGAKTPLPYNRLGEILEKRKDYRGALDAYGRSLQVEWNQPPIIEARKRLEKLSAE